MMNLGTIWTHDVPDDSQFPLAVVQATSVAAQRFGYVDPVPDYLDVDVKFLACSKYGDVYMVHITDPTSQKTASVRLTQLSVLHGDRQIPLGTL